MLMIYVCLTQFHAQHTVTAYPIQTTNTKNNAQDMNNKERDTFLLADYVKEDVSEKDLDSIYQQLGYIPPNLVRVSARRKNGQPLALQTYPLNGGAAARKKSKKSSLIPFPTLFWFCCPEVGRAIADLERTGHVNILQQKMESNPEYIKRWHQNHNTYAEKRWMSLTDEHRSLLSVTETTILNTAVELQNTLITPETRERMRQMLQESGIAGIDYRKEEQTVPSIKCLHAHYAHYRSCLERESSQSQINIVGEWTHELLQKLNPDLEL